MNRIAKIAAAAAVTGALALPASQAFAASKTENALIGAAVGALAGTLLSNGGPEATIAGAAIGGLVGAAADKPDHRRRAYHRGRDVRYVDRPYREAPRYRSSYAPSYRDSHYGSSYAVPAGYRYGYGY